MEDLYSSQETLLRHISRTMDNLKKIGKSNLTRAILQTKIANLEATWSTFQAQDEQILRGATELEKKHPYFSADVYLDVEAVYCVQRGQLLDMLNDLEPAESSSSKVPAPTSVLQPRATLPKLDIPTFAGNLTEWKGWEELFQSLVISSSTLTDIERFHYLSASLSGEAAQLIKRVPRVAANFPQAWELLQRRYSNRRLLVDAQFDCLHDIRPMSAHTAGELTRLLDSTCNVVAALRSLSISVEDHDYWIVHHTLRRLDKRSITAWEEAMGTSTEPALLSELLNFLEMSIRKLSAVESHGRTGQPPPSSSRKVKVHHTMQGKPKPGRCPLCQGDHILCYCGVFRSKTPEQRRSLVTTKTLCLNCFGSHSTNDCRSPRTCQKCAAKHHTMLHEAFISSTENLAASSMHVMQRPSQLQKRPTAVLLATAILRVSVNDRTCTARALIDPCSEVTLVTESLVQRLRIPRESCTVTVLGAGATPTARARGKVEFLVSSCHGTKDSARVEALILPTLTAYRPRCTVASSSWPHLEGLTLADPNFASSEQIDVLLGVDVYPSIMLEETRKGGPNAPLAHRSIFGWILSGPLSHDGDAGNPETTSHTCTATTELHDLVQRFWEQENLPPTQVSLTAEDEACEQHFKRTYEREPDGRILEVNGKLVVGSSKSDLARLLAVVPDAAQIVVLRKGDSLAALRTLRSDNLRLTHRIEYLEEQIRDFLASNRTEILTSVSPTHHDKVQVFQKGPQVTTLVGNFHSFNTKKSIEQHEKLPMVKGKHSDQFNNLIHAKHTQETESSTDSILSRLHKLQNKQRHQEFPLKHIFKSHKSAPRIKCLDFDSEPTNYWLQDTHSRASENFDASIIHSFHKTKSRLTPPKKPLRLSIHRAASLQSVESAPPSTLQDLTRKPMKRNYKGDLPKDKSSQNEVNGETINQSWQLQLDSSQTPSRTPSRAKSYQSALRWSSKSNSYLTAVVMEKWC